MNNQILTTAPFRVVTLKDQPGLKKELDRLHTLGWPPFIRKDLLLGEKWEQLLTLFPHFQYFLLDESYSIVACGHAIPFYWTGSEADLPQGWEAVFEKGLRDYEDHLIPNSASALAIVIAPEHRGKGLSEEMVWAMKALVKEQGLKNMVAPLRPALKSKYPLISMDDYMYWKRADGQAYDPWIRAHLRTGASLIKVAVDSTVVKGTIEEWKSWINMDFLSSGQYVIPGGLVPLDVDLEMDSGIYREPNVWIQHDL